MKSPLELSHDDLIKHTRNQIEWMEQNHDRMKLEGRITAWSADHKLACAKKILEVLKETHPQQNLFKK